LHREDTAAVDRGAAAAEVETEQAAAVAGPGNRDAKALAAEGLVGGHRAAGKRHTAGVGEQGATEAGTGGPASPGKLVRADGRHGPRARAEAGPAAPPPTASAKTTGAHLAATATETTGGLEQSAAVAETVAAAQASAAHDQVGRGQAVRTRSALRLV